MLTESRARSSSDFSDKTVLESVMHSFLLLANVDSSRVTLAFSVLRSASSLAIDRLLFVAAALACFFWKNDYLYIRTN